VAIVEGGQPPEADAAASTCQSYGIPMVATAATDPGLTERGDFVFRVCVVDALEGRALARFARRALDARVAAILVEAGDADNARLAESFGTEWRTLGGRIDRQETYAAAAGPGLHAGLRALRERHPDVLLIAGGAADSGRIARNARTSGLSARLLGGDGWSSPQLLALGGSALEGAHFPVRYDPDDPSPLARRFASRYRRAAGRSADAEAALSYDAVRMLAEAIDRAGATDGQRIRDALAATSHFAGATGTLMMDADRNPIESVGIVAIEHGRVHYVTAIAP
jgi:branched-chain amino acid transport system substrate-binding protein